LDELGQEADGILLFMVSRGRRGSGKSAFGLSVLLCTGYVLQRLTEHGDEILSARIRPAIFDDEGNNLEIAHTRSKIVIHPVSPCFFFEKILMFSANENLQLRQHKRRVVGYVEETIPEDVLDAGVNVMVMQVSCKAPGCVPLETAIVVVFPAVPVAGDDGGGELQELLPGLPESRGGSYKTKVLKPMAEVTKQDVLEALPPAFEGGQRSMEKLCLQARDVMLGQITQLFGDEDVPGRRLLAMFLQESLQDYIERGCEPPEWGEPFSEKETSRESSGGGISGGGNIVIRRPVDDEDNNSSIQRPVEQSNAGNTKTATSSSPRTAAASPPSVNTVTRRWQQQAAERVLDQQARPLLSQLQERDHIRRRGCPCCDPDHPSNVLDQLMML
jgi:hypothetical protein